MPERRFKARGPNNYEYKAELFVAQLQKRKNGVVGIGVQLLDKSALNTDLWRMRWTTARNMDEAKQVVSEAMGKLLRELASVAQKNSNTYAAIAERLLDAATAISGEPP